MVDYYIREQNNIDHACCPTCGRMHPLQDDKDQRVKAPTDCHRCGGPMDWEKAKAHGDALAKAAHDPRIAQLGVRSRGESQVTAAI